MKTSLTRLTLIGIGFSTIAICSMSSREGFTSSIIEGIRRKYKKRRAANKKGVNKGSEPNLHLPDEIVTEILSWLPVKSIQRLKCVCKLWFSISQDRAFIHQHMMRATNTIWAVEEGNGHVIRNICQGLILEKKGPKSNYRLRNPSTKRVLDLPDPKVVEEYAMKSCYVSSTKTFKLVLPFANNELKGNGSFKILTVDVDDDWRTLDLPFTCNLAGIRNWSINVFAGMYVLAKLPKIESEEQKREIVILEFENEKLWRVNIPRQGLFSSWGNVCLVNWAGKPSLCQRSGDDDELLHVWVVEDYKKQKWAQEKIVIDLASAKELCRGYKPYWFYNSKLDMHCNDEKFLKFDAVSKLVTHSDPPTTRGRKYHGLPSLMEFKGMKPLPA